MSIFVILMIVGLAGLLMLALPGLSQHGSLGHGIGSGGHGLGQGLGHGGGVHLPGLSHGQGALPHGAVHAVGSAPLSHLPAHAGHNAGGESYGSSAIGSPGRVADGPALLRLIPSPRSVFSLVTLFGAFGYGIAGAAHLAVPVAAGAAVVPAWLVERFMVTPLWNVLFRFEGKPSSSLEELVTERATAVTPFRNGRGLVQVVRDGRAVQLNARLTPTQTALPVRVGDGLVIEEVDAPNERVTVSLE